MNSCSRSSICALVIITCSREATTCQSLWMRSVRRPLAFGVHRYVECLQECDKAQWHFVRRNKENPGLFMHGVNAWSNMDQYALTRFVSQTSTTALETASEIDLTKASWSAILNSITETNKVRKNCFALSLTTFTPELTGLVPAQKQIG